MKKERKENRGEDKVRKSAKNLKTKWEKKVKGSEKRKYKRKW